MKILIINDNATLCGGAEQVISNLMSDIKRRKHNIYLLGFEQANQSGIPIKQKAIVLTESKFSFLRLLGRILISPKLLLKARSIIKKVNPDIIDIHSNYKYPLTVLLACIGYPKIKTIHDFGFLCLGINVIKKPGAVVCTRGISIHCLLNHCVSLRKFLVMYLSRKIYALVEKKSFSAFITMNKQFYSRLINLGYQNVIYLPNTTDEKLVRTIKRKAVNKLSQIYTICYIGHLGGHKGVDILIKSLPAVLEKIDVRLKIIGDDIENNNLNMALLKKMSHQLRLDNYVEFTGRLSHRLTIKMLSGSSVLILPSVCAEYFGLVILEAMTLGIPVVGSDIGGIPELIKDGKTGYIFEPGNSKQLANKLIKLFNNPLLRTKMGKHGQILYNKYYNSERHYTQLIKLYNKVLRIRMN